MSISTLVDQVKSELALTTDSYPTWKKKNFAPGHWANAYAFLDQIVGKPTDPNGRWYSSDSPWNLPIPVNPTLAANNQKIVLGLKYTSGLTTFSETAQVRSDGSSNNPFVPNHVVNLAFNGVPCVGVITSSTPTKTVRVNYPPCGGTISIQIPTDLALQANGMENSCCLIYPDGTEIDFFKMTAPGVQLLLSDKWCFTTPDGAKWTAVIASVHKPGWDGPGYGVSSTRESNTLNGAGMIRTRDFQTPVGGHWDHAIAWVGGPLANYNVPPFSHGIGDNNVGTMKQDYCIPYGGRWQLDPLVPVDLLNNNGSFALSGVGDAPEWKKQYCRTLQIHGAFPVDSNSSGSGTGWTSILQYPYTLFVNQLGFGNGSDDNIPASLAGSFRVLDWNDPRNYQ